MNHDNLVAQSNGPGAQSVTLRVIAGRCSGGECPTIYRTDRGTLIVQGYAFDPAAVAKNLTKFPELQTWLPELADRFESEFVDKEYSEENIETLVKAFTEEKGTKLGVIMNGARI